MKDSQNLQMCRRRFLASVAALPALTGANQTSESPLSVPAKPR